MKCIITANNQTGHLLKRKGEFASTTDALRESVAGWIASGELRNNDRMLSVMVYVEKDPAEER